MEHLLHISFILYETKNVWCEYWHGKTTLIKFIWEIIVRSNNSALFFVQKTTENKES